MKGKVMLPILILLLVSACSVKDVPTRSYEGWELVWQDEFEEDGAPDPDVWSVMVAPKGFSNGEWQKYTREPENVRVEDGRLIIEAHLDGRDYTSGKVRTRREMGWTYGRIEVMARLPKGVGTWPAIWMLPAGGSRWPDGGEIDIMEHVGFDHNNIHSTIHTNRYNHPSGTQRGASLMVERVDRQFHLYQVEWYPDRLDFYVDDQFIFTFENDNTDWRAWPFDKDFNLILNLAVGGDWAGSQGVDEKAFPCAMEVEYVRYYREVE